MSKAERANADYLEFKRLSRESSACGFALASARRRLLEAARDDRRAEAEKLAEAVEARIADREKVETQLTNFKEHFEKRKAADGVVRRRLPGLKAVRDELVGAAAKEEIAAAALKKDMDELKERRAVGSDEIEAASAALRAIEAERTAMRAGVDELKRGEVELEARVAELKSRHEAIVNRQALANRFGSNKADRDAFLRGKMEKFEAIGRGCREQITANAAAVAEAKDALNQKKILRDEVAVDRVAEGEKAEAYAKKRASLEKKLGALKADLAGRIKLVEAKEAEVDAAETDLRRIEDGLAFMPRPVKRGYDSMRTIIDALREEEAENDNNNGRTGYKESESSFDAAGLLAGYHGLLADHVKPLHDSYATAVQVR